MKVFAVIAAYNEESTIGIVIKDLQSEVEKIIVVDDGSSDHTYQLAKQTGAVVLQHFLNRGQGAALQTGISCALKLGADMIVTFDADGQHNKADICKIIKPILKLEADITVGSRFLDAPSFKLQDSNFKMPFSKFLILKLAIIFDKLRTGLPLTDTHNGLRALSRQAAEKIYISQDGMAHASEILEQISKLKLKFKEVPVNVIYTKYSKHKGQSIFNSFKIIRDLILGKIAR